MRIFEFIDKYCQDLIRKRKEQSKLIDLTEFPHDAVIKDNDGEDVPVVYIDSESVPISDILTLDKADFVYAWKLPSAANVYTEYMNLMEILEGEEVLFKVRNAILNAKRELESDVELVTSV